MVVAGLSSSAASGSVGAPPMTVSPGEVGRIERIADRCPTFSWSAFAGAERYEVVVYKLSSEEGRPHPAVVLRTSVPGGALAWTPGEEDCLDPEGRYAWTIGVPRSEAGSEWSEPRLFEIGGLASDDQLIMAAALLERYLDAGGTLERLLAGYETPGAPETEAERVDTVAAAGARPSVVRPEPQPSAAAISGESALVVEGEIACPAGTHRAGAWCIGPQTVTRDYNGSQISCWNQGMQLCPLDAILACDLLQPVGADCTTLTDALTTQWIWCAEQSEANDVNAYVGGTARVFAGSGNHVGNEVDFASKSDTNWYFCCLPRR